MSAIKILIIEDDVSIASVLRVTLNAKGYLTEETSTVSGAISKINEFSPDIALLDLQLLDGNGEEVLTTVRKFTSIPILILSIINDEKTKIKLLDLGADDYITKPFSMGELLARIRVSLRKEKLETPLKAWNSNGLTIDLEQRRIYKNTLPIRLTPTEFQILAILLKNLDRVVTYETLIETIWGKEAINEMNSLRVHINQIRKKLEDDPQNPRHLITEGGIGYQWVT